MPRHASPLRGEALHTTALTLRGNVTRSYLTGAVLRLSPERPLRTCARASPSASPPASWPSRDAFSRQPSYACSTLPPNSASLLPPRAADLSGGRSPVHAILRVR